jgi:hypothetical protein
MAPSASQREAFAALKVQLESRTYAPGRLPLDRVIPLEIEPLDRLLGGGVPRATLVTLEGRAGRWSLAARAIAQVTQRALAAVVDDGTLYPPDLARGGTRLDRLMIVPAQTPLRIARAADLLVRSRACRLIVIPAPDVRPAVWARLANLAHRNGVTVLAVVQGIAPPALAGAAGVRLHCLRERSIVAGKRGLWGAFAGYELRMELRKYRSFSSGGHACVQAVDPRAARERFGDVAVR